MLSLVLAVACGPLRVEELEVQELESEVLSADPATGVVALAPLGMLVASSEGLAERHPLSQGSTWVWDRPSTLYGATRSAELGLVVVTEEALLTGQGLLGISPLEAETGPVAKVHAAGDALILESTQGVFAWRAGQLWELAGFAGPVAIGRDDSVYLQQATDRVRLVRSGAGWAELEREKGRAYGRGVDGAGTLWTLGEGAVERSDGLAWSLPTEMQSLSVCAHAEGAWVRDDEGTVWYLDTEPRVRAEVPEHAVLDGQCRWLVADEQGIERLSWGRPVGLWGLEEGEEILGDTPITVLPTLPEWVADIDLRVEGEEQDLDDGSWILQPGLWPTGGTLEIVITYEDNVTSTLVRSFSVGDAGEPTWTEDVEPIYKTHCALCHANGTETVLADAPAWEANIDAILSSVSSGTMPLGKTPLTGAQIATIRAWEAGGFE